MTLINNNAINGGGYLYKDVIFDVCCPSNVWILFKFVVLTVS